MTPLGVFSEPGSGAENPRWEALAVAGEGVWHALPRVRRRWDAAVSVAGTDHGEERKAT
ncbi:hypothetical protein GCM10009851_36750 [Herbiconiux moechotypicola]|uniref:Uncharacterized protein n=1 Tax=Herbiconiux moechotypicola TaxID=637393 RepID=A0ABN3E4T7_9MICO